MFLIINNNNFITILIIFLVWFYIYKFYIITYYMNFSLILFLIGILGFVLNRKNIILMLISIEIMLLSITFLILISSLNFDDILGQTFAIYIITIAGAESAIGLGILVAFYRFASSLISYCKFYNNNIINNHNTFI
jgi:NADH-ubiquinone oxidoreductase chain 4L